MGKDKPDERPLPLYLFLIIRYFAGICLTVIAKWVKFIGVQKICLSLHLLIKLAFDAFQP